MPQVAPLGVTPEEQKTLQKEMDTEKGRAMLARRIGHVLDELLSHAGRSEKDLRFLCAHLYGDQIERFYTACVMVLAAAESGTLTLSTTCAWTGAGKWLICCSNFQQPDLWATGQNPSRDMQS